MITAERTQRQQLVREIIGSHELEGVVVTEVTKCLLDTYARGDVSADDMLAQAVASLGGRGQQLRLQVWRKNLPMTHTSIQQLA